MGEKKLSTTLNSSLMLSINTLRNNNNEHVRHPIAQSTRTKLTQYSHRIIKQEGKKKSYSGRTTPNMRKDKANKQKFRADVRKR